MLTYQCTVSNFNSCTVTTLRTHCSSTRLGSIYFCFYHVLTPNGDSCFFTAGSTPARTRRPRACSPRTAAWSTSAAISSPPATPASAPPIPRCSSSRPAPSPPSRCSEPAGQPPLRVKRRGKSRRRLAVVQQRAHPPPAGVPCPCPARRFRPDGGRDKIREDKMGGSPRPAHERLTTRPTDRENNDISPHRTASHRIASQL